MTLTRSGGHWVRGFFVAAAAIAPLLSGCGAAPQPPKEVVVYTALDEEFSRPIFDAFTR